MEYYQNNTTNHREKITRTYHQVTKTTELDINIHAR